MFTRNKSFLEKINKRRNPLRVEKGRWIKFFFRFLNLAIITCLIYFLYFFFISPYYNITSIQVRGLQYISPDEILKLSQEYLGNNKFGFLKTKNIILFNSNKLKSNIEREYLFASMQVEKKFPNALIVDIVERPIRYRLYTDSAEYLLDSGGVVVRKVTTFKNRPQLLSLTPQEEKSVEEVKKELHTFNKNDQFALIYYEKENELFGLGDEIFGRQAASLISQVVENQSKQLLDADLLAIPSKKPQFLRVRVKIGYNVILNVNDALEGQIKALEAVVSGKIGLQNLNRLDYIDLRLGDSIYFKYR